MPDEPDEAVRTRRSAPGYPGIDLGVAVERLADLYRVSSTHPVPLAAAASEWGFSAKSSNNQIVAAALKRFGFVKDAGGRDQRQLVLTQAGREVAFYASDRDNSRWPELLRTAAEHPRLHRQVLDHFDSELPDERVVLPYLLFDVGFPNEVSARDFLRRFRATLDFVKSAEKFAESPSPPDNPSEVASEGGIVPDAGPRKEQREGVWRAPSEGPAERHLPLTPPTPSVYEHFLDRTTVQIPYSHERWASLSAEFPMSPAQWDALIAMLSAMRPGLVDDES